jgi:two-component system cell cycle sensor histidine kinase/response regulator CckA
VSDPSAEIERLRAENEALRRRVAQLEQAMPSGAAAGVDFGSVFEQLPIPIVLYRPDGTAVAINQSNAALVATPAAAIVGHHNIFQDPQAIDLGYVDHFREALQGRIAAMPPTSYDTARAELEGRTTDRCFWAESTYFPVYDGQGELVVVGEVNQDVTAKIQSEQERRHLRVALEERESRLRTIFDYTSLGIVFVSPEGYIIEANQAFARMLGLRPDDLRDRNVLKYTHPADRERVQQLIAELRSGVRESFSIEKRYVRASQETVTARLYVSNVRDLEFGSPYSIAFVEDITPQLRTEEALRSSQSLLSTLLEQTPLLVFAKDRQGYYVLANRHFAASVGRMVPEVLGRHERDLFDPETARLNLEFDREVLASEQPVEREQRVIIQGEERIYTTIKFPLYDGSGVCYAVCGIAIETTERVRHAEAQRAFERRMAEIQKLESLGLLASGIAHDFNNLLVTILGNASLLLEDAPVVSDPRLVLSQIEHAARRASDLTRQMLAYAGKSRPDVRPVDLNGLIQEMAPLLQSALSRSVQLALPDGTDLPPISADPTQLRQILMNLVINGGEAIGAAGGLVRVQIGLVEADQDVLVRNFPTFDLPAGSYVSLEISDNGKGMDESVRAKVFEPFFSTKHTGRGLGLSVVLGIVRSHGGGIQVTSEPGRGTTFVLYFPALPNASVDVAGTGAHRLRRYSGTVLLAEHDPEVRIVTARMLASLGFTVQVAGSGADVAELLAGIDQPYTLAMIDVALDNASPAPVIAAVQTAAATTPILLLSGFGRDIDQISQSHAVIEKPFSTLDLDAALAVLFPSEG